MQRHLAEFVFDEPEVEIGRRISTEINKLVRHPAIRGIHTNGYDGKWRLRVKFDDRTNEAWIREQLNKIFDAAKPQER